MQPNSIAVNANTVHNYQMRAIAETRSGSFWVAGACLIALGWSSAQAAETGTLVASTTTPPVSTTTTFTVTVSVGGASGFSCWGQVLRFDKTKVSLTAQGGGAFTTFVPDSRSLADINNSGEVRTGGYYEVAGTPPTYPNNGGGSGSVAVLTFKRIASGTTDITSPIAGDFSWTLINAAGANRVLATVPTKVTLTDPVSASSVAGTKIFYNNSAWDGNNAAANASDDAAIATNKSALRPGQTATFANYTSYSRGINGVMVDVISLPSLPSTPTASDFIFTVGNNNTPAGWAAAPVPTTVAVRAGAGAGASSRISLIWTDNAIQKQWLRVEVKATGTTGLTAPYVFYVGNAIGDCGDNATNTYAGVGDQLGVRINGVVPGTALVTNVYDYNRDKSVGVGDQLVVRLNGTGPGSSLALVAVP